MDWARRTAILVMLSWASAGGAEADYLAAYTEGLRSRDFGKWREAVQFFAAAARENPTEGEWVRPYGTWLEHYMPHYYLGESLFEVGSYRAALTEWKIAESEGVLGVPRNEKKLAHVQAERVRLADEILPELRRSLRDDLDKARQVHQRLEKLTDRADESLKGRWRSIGNSLKRAEVILERAEGGLLTMAEEARFLIDEAWSDLAVLREIQDAAVASEQSSRESVEFRSFGSVTGLDRYDGSYALVVGVHSYETWSDLPGVATDLYDVAQGLRRQGFEVEVIENPGRTKLEKAIDRFVRKRGRDRAHRLVFYYAGHGWSESNFNVRLGYIVPSDAGDPRIDAVNLAGLISMDRFAQIARDIEAEHVLFAFDSCFSGTVFHAARARAMGPGETGRSGLEGADGPARLFMTAGDVRERVPDESAFKASLLGGLRGPADSDDDGFVLGRELGIFIKARGSTAHSSPQWGYLEDPRYRVGDVIFAPVPDE